MNHLSGGAAAEPKQELLMMLMVLHREAVSARNPVGGGADAAGAEERS